MPRDENGFLKADALRNGLRDQFAVDKDGVTHVVEIAHDIYMYGGYAVRHIRMEGGRVDRTADLYQDDLRKAQAHFARIVRGLGGRA